MRRRRGSPPPSEAVEAVEPQPVEGEGELQTVDEAWFAGGTDDSAVFPATDDLDRPVVTDADAATETEVDASTPAVTDTQEIAQASIEPVLEDGDDDAQGPPVVHISLRDEVAADLPPGERPVLLRVTDLRAGYGVLPVLLGISFEVHAGETVVLLGLNGAGKTTTALAIAGAVRPRGGRIEFDGQDATTWSTRRAVKEGIVLVPEGRRVFPDLSVEKNLQVGAWTARRDSGWLETQRERVYDYFPRLRERTSQKAGTLSGGEQQMLAIARGLMARPKLLIIDEASLGLAPVIVKSVFEIVSHINDDGITVILVEQNVGALGVADLGLVMEKGTIAASFRGDELRDPSVVRKVFLG